MRNSLKGTDWKSLSTVTMRNESCLRNKTKKKQRNTTSALENWWFLQETRKFYLLELIKRTLKKLKRAQVLLYTAYTVYLPWILSQAFCFSQLSCSLHNMPGFELKESFLIIAQWKKFFSLTDYGKCRNPFPSEKWNVHNLEIIKNLQLVPMLNLNYQMLVLDF